MVVWNKTVQFSKNSHGLPNTFFGKQITYSDNPFQTLNNDVKFMSESHLNPVQSTSEVVLTKFIRVFFLKVGFSKIRCQLKGITYTYVCTKYHAIPLIFRYFKLVP